MNMRIALLALLFTISLCNGLAHFGHYFDPILRSYYVLPPHTTPVLPGTTPNIEESSEEDDREASEKGVKVPFDCLLSWDEFKRYIINRNWLGVYVIDDDSSLFPVFSYKFSVLWTLQNDTTIRRRASYWDNIENECGFLDAMFTRIDDSRAIFGPQTANGNAFITSTRRDMFVCSDEGDVCIFYVCYESEKISDDRCPTTEIFILFEEQRNGPPESNGIRKGNILLNDVSWTELDDTLKTCLEQTFVDETDPQISWGWRNSDCAEPGTEAFENGFAG